MRDKIQLVGAGCADRHPAQYDDNTVSVNFAG